MTLSTPTALVSGSNAADLATYTTASSTIQPKSLVVVFVVSGKASNLAQSPTDLTHSNGLAVTKIGSLPVPNTNLVLSAWSYSNSTASAIAGTVSINHAIVMDNCAWHITHYQSDVAVPTVRQNAWAATAVTTEDGPAVTNNCLSTSVMVGALGYNSGSANTPTVGTGFTALGTRQTITSPTIQLLSEYDNTAPPRTATFTTPVSAGRSQVSIEIADGVATTPTSPFYVWNGTTEVQATVTMWNGTAEVPVTL